MSDNLIHLKSEQASATILSNRGGLVRDLVLCPRGSQHSELTPQNIIWTSDSFKESGSGWPGGGLAVLFPFSGRVWNSDGIEGSYVFDGVEYPMPIHGFLYSRDMTITHKSVDHLQLSLESDTVTQAVYPFDFFLTLDFRLTSSQLEIKLVVKNSSKVAMPVAPGLHPYFNIDLDFAGELFVPAKTRYRVHTNGDVSRPEEYSPGNYALNESSIQSAVFSDLTENLWVLKQEHYNLAIRQSESFGFTTLWTIPGEPYYCVEPWTALPNAPARIQQQVGARMLAPDESLELKASFSLE